MAEFFDMGGYAAFVWPAWAVAVLILGGLLVVSLVARARVRRQLERRGLDRRSARDDAGTGLAGRSAP